MADRVKLDEILRAADRCDASDVHLVAGHPPMARVHTVLQPLDLPKLAPEDMWVLLAAITVEHQRRQFERDLDLDFSYEIAGFRRYRVNAHMQRGAVGMALRAIQTKVPTLASLHLPDVIAQLTSLPRGLVLVTGDTGSGKSTTLAAMIEAMNERDRKHVVTLEDPIEYTFESRRCLIEQRELGADTPSFANALRHALRQDPDVILVGEMRDLDTTALALTAAETGHLVLSTLHTSSAAQTVERIVDMYPASQQSQVRAMLANVLQAVISQTLLPRIDRPGMVPAVEVLLCTPAVRNIIREARTHEIPSVIETGRAMGMCTLDAAISELYFNGMISRDDAIAQSSQAGRLDRMLAA